MLNYCLFKKCNLYFFILFKLEILTIIIAFNSITATINETNNKFNNLQSFLFFSAFFLLSEENRKENIA